MPYEPVIIKVDSRPVAAESLTYRGLDLAFGPEHHDHPWVIVKVASNGAWPDLHTIPDGTEATS
jgi:hypothetical protein